MKGISDILPILDTGEALLIGDAVMLPTRIRLDKPTIAPTSATKDFWVEWQNHSGGPEVIAAAIGNLRRQSRIGTHDTDRVTMNRYACFSILRTWRASQSTEKTWLHCSHW